MDKTQTSWTAVQYDQLRQLTSKTFELGEAVLNLYRSGSLSDDALHALCADILALEAALTIQSQAASIPASAPAVSVAVAEATESQSPNEITQLDIPAAADDDTFVVAPAASTCPTCHSPLRPEVKFCTTCGTRIEAGVTPIVPDSVPASSRIPEPVAHYCTDCGLGVAAGVAECPNCGSTNLS
ncbi:MAG: zinc ribbon domain-containing protein [Chloroflexota bacterium]